MRVSITHTVKWRALLCITAALTAAAIVGCRKFDEPTPTPAPPAAVTMSLADLHDLCRDTTLEIPMEAPGLYLCEVADAARRVEAPTPAAPWVVAKPTEQEMPLTRMPKTAALRRPT